MGQESGGGLRRTGPSSPRLVSRSVNFAAGDIDIARAVAAIDRIHGDGELPTIVVRRQFLPAGQQGHYDAGYPQSIAIASDAIRPGMAKLHEVGHLLDRCGLGDGTRFASSGNPLLRPWRATIRGSQAFKMLEGQRQAAVRVSGATAYLTYLMRDEELWARSYAQFVASRSGNRHIVDQLNQSRFRTDVGIGIPVQWSDADFQPIANEIERVFRRKGWMP